MEASTNKSREQLESRHILIEHPQANEDFVSSIKEKMKDISSSETIFMVPEKLRTGNEKVYIPDKVSIGPLHHGISTLTAMEDHKWRYLYALLSRKPNLEGILDGCVKALRELEQRARKCYAKEFDQLTADQFVEMMLVDGCFIIELLCKYVVKGLRCRNDPIFTTPGMLLSIRCDIILSENQIPLFILRNLFEIVPIPRQCKDQTLNELAFRFFRNMLPCDEEVVNEKISQEGNHLLDLISHFYLPSYPREQVKQSGSSEVIECAKMLQEAGIRFRKVTAKSVLDIMFFDGVIEIPPLKIYRFSEVLFANLIALEQHNCDMQYVTSYAFLMSALIRSDKDARLLRRHRILISNEYKDIKDVYESFQKYKWEEVNVKDLYYAGLFEQINDQYRRRNWSAWLGNLKHKLCHS
ncbi:hypothetical protein O6P43_021854 [Quillaja saponaria]|uniref:Uncharacterized protein n=1 Tax=Quillaja saponaria TaxID=32244 RepID=A0AAD7PGY4_QUISA|nr:hypothetical protein O6P43_021854 [Quillaja saponaria]